MYVSPRNYFSLAILWAVAVYFCGRNFGDLPAEIVFLVFVLLSAPLVLVSLYLTTIRKIDNVARFSSQGWLFRIKAARLFVTAVGVIAAILSAVFMLLQFQSYLLREWAAFLLVIPLLYVVYWLMFHAVRGELKPYGQVAAALRYARRITPFVALVPYLLVVWFAGERLELASLADAVALRQGEVDSRSGSAVVRELAKWASYYDGARLYAGARLSTGDAFVALLVLAAGAWVVFYGAACMLSSFLVPRREYGRVFASLSEVENPPAVEQLRVIVTIAIAVVIVMAAFSAFAWLEHSAVQRAAPLAEAHQRAQATVVRIDGLLYRPEVQDEINSLKIGLVRELEDLQPRLERSLDAAFDRMEDNIDPFLDWYYQLTAEYLRTLNLLRGQIEGFVAGKLQRYLEQGNPFEEFEALLADALERHEYLSTRFHAGAEAALARHAVTSPPDAANAIIIEELSLASLLAFPSPDETIPFPVRAGTGGAAGAITVAVTAKVIAKLYAKGAIKLAAQPLTKAVVTRGVVAAGGAATGAAAGTAVLPGIGTGAGALIGLVIGLAAGVGVDYGLLKLEEFASREAFRADLLQAVRDVREEYRAARLPDLGLLPVRVSPEAVEMQVGR